MSLLLHGIDHLSPSAAATLTSCERKWWWRYQRKLGRDERSEPLATGGGLATALEHGSLERGLAEYADRRPVPDVFTDAAVYERDGWIGEAIIREAYQGYVLRWPDGPDFQRELTYLVALPDTTRVAQVRVDGRAGAHLVEDKLRSASSMRAEAIENELRQGRQLTAEIWAHWRCTGDLLPLKLRSTKKPDKRKLKACVTRDDVEAIVAEHFAKDGTFNEWEATRTVEQLEEFEQEFRHLARAADGLAAVPFPAGRRNTDACHMYGRVCPALAHCQGMATEAELLGETA